MKNALEILRDAVDGAGQLEARKLGEGAQSEPPTEIAARAARAVEQIQRTQHFNQGLVAVLTGMLVGLFGVGLFLVIIYRNSPALMAGVFGGTFLSLLAVVDRLRRIWIDKNILDVSAAVLQGLPPDKAALFIKTLYFHLLERHGEKARLTPATKPQSAG